jgi:hypothetical protein
MVIAAVAVFLGTVLMRTWLLEIESTFVRIALASASGVAVSIGALSVFSAGRRAMSGLIRIIFVAGQVKPRVAGHLEDDH